MTQEPNPLVSFPVNHMLSLTFNYVKNYFCCLMLLWKLRYTTI